MWQKRTEPIKPGEWGLFEITAHHYPSHIIAFGFGTFGWNAYYVALSITRRVFRVWQRSRRS